MDYTIRGGAHNVAAQLDGEGRSWIEVMPTAEKAENGGKRFTITADDLDAAARYIIANPERIPVDYDHAGAEGGSSIAAGWFTGNAEVREGSLWAEVAWTPQAQQEIRDGRFRFISPEWTMASRDAKTGLLSKFEKLRAATLTNRPFFSQMAPVTARELLDSDVLQRLSEYYTATELLEALRSNVFVAAETESAPSGDESNQGDQVDLPELAKKLGLAEDADENAITAKLDELDAYLKAMNESTNDNDGEVVEASAEEENDVAETTDYLKALGLKADDPKDAKVAAAFNERTEQIIALTQEVSNLKAKLAESDQLNDRIAELEKRDRKREIEILLSKAVENGQATPAEKESLTAVGEADLNLLRTVLASRPAGTYRRTSQGSGRDIDRFADDQSVAELSKEFSGSIDGVDIPVDTESAKAHLLAVKALEEKGVKESDEDYDSKYIAAVEKAERELATA